MGDSGPHTNGNGTTLKPFPVYLDYNATTPLDEHVVQEVSRSLKIHWGNPSSSHIFGEQAKAAIEQSRAAVAGMINADPCDIIFTSGGTEANNYALLSLIKWAQNGNPNVVPHIITSNVEHDSVARVLDNQKHLGQIELTIVAVDKSGQLHSEDVLSLIKENTCAISIMHANNETGVILPIQEIGAQLVKVNSARSVEGKPQVFFHCDAAQTIGKVEVDVRCLRVDLLTIVGHKFYAPKIGALYCKDLNQRSTLLHPLFQGGCQERSFRPGTENTPMIVGLGKAAELVQDNLRTFNELMMKLANSLAFQLKENIPGLKINFAKVPDRLPNTVSVCLPEGFQANIILNEKCKGKLLASLGAACHSNVEKPSEILLASGLSSSEASRTIRLSVGRTTTMEEIACAVETLKTACMN